MKKLTTLVLVLLTFTNSYLAYGQAAVVTDPANTAQQSVNTAQSVKATTKDFKLDKIPIKIAKKMLDKMTDSVVVWAAGGFKKEGPAFIGNFKEFAKDSAIAAGATAIDEIVEQGERYASSNLTAAEKAEEKKCIDSKKEYDSYYNLISQGLLVAGINIDGLVVSYKDYGPLLFNSFLANHGGYPSYALGNGQVNDAVLRDFIETEIMLNPARLAESGIPGDVNVIEGLIKTNDKCKKTLAAKVAGLSYTNSLVKFVGATYRNSRKGTASRVGVPNFDNFGAAYTKSLSDNWKGYQSDASVGGWAAWGESAKLSNNPWGAKYQLQADLSDQLAQDLGEKTAQIQRNAGFLDKGECKTWKTLDKASGGTEKICVDYEANNPGSIIREAVNKRVTQQYDQLNNVSEWEDLLLTTGVKLVSGVLQEGVLPLANNAIDKGLADLAAQFDDSANGQTVVASSQTITNSGTGLDDVVDIKSVLYGPLVIEKDQKSNVIYERIDSLGNRVREKRNNKTGALIEYVARAPKDDPTKNINAYDVVYKVREVYKKNPVTQQFVLDSDGKKVVDKYIATKGVGTALYTDFGIGGVSSTIDSLLTIDYASPQYAYVYDQDTNGIIIDQVQFETHPLTGSYVFDSNGDKIPKLKRENGALPLIELLQNLLTAQNSFIKNKGIRKLMELDHALPGPDLGWEDRLAEKGGELVDNAPSSLRNAQREIFEKVKRVFQDGVTGSMVNDPFDVVMVLAGSPEIFTNPYYSFKSFKYPVEVPGGLKFVSNGAVLPQVGTTAANYKQLIDSALPKQMTLTRSDRTDSEIFNVAPMNTHPGLWFNPATSQIEAVGNIPDSQDMRELALAVQVQYTEAVDNYNRRSNELRVIQVKLKELQRRYESLPYLSPTAPLESRVERDAKENQIAYEISIIRDRLPIYDEVAELQSQIKDTLATYDRMGEMIEGTQEYRTQSGYATRFDTLQAYRGDEQDDTVYKGAKYYSEDPGQLARYRDLLLKDKMGILYCALQDHASLNMETPANKAGKLSNLLSRAQELAALISPVTFLASSLGWGPNASDGYLYSSGGDSAYFNPFGGFSASETVKKKWLKSGSRMKDTYDYYVPYRCYETSVLCQKDGDPSCGSYKWECPFGAGHNDNDDALLAAMPLGCNQVYRSSYGDYLKLIDSTQ